MVLNQGSGTTRRQGIYEIYVSEWSVRRANDYCADMQQLTSPERPWDRIVLVVGNGWRVNLYWQPTFLLPVAYANHRFKQTLLRSRIRLLLTNHSRQ